MTIPAIALNASTDPVPEMLGLPKMPQPAALDLLRRALTASVDDAAFKVLAVAALKLPPGQFHPIGTYALAAGVKHHQIRQQLAELAAAGLLDAGTVRVIVSGAKRKRTAYRLAVTA